MKSSVVYKISCTSCEDDQTVGDTNEDDQSVGDTREDDQSVGMEEDQSVGDVRRHPSVYIGQTGRSLHSRMSEHLAGLKRMEKSCPLAKHVTLSHGGVKEDARFKSKILHGARTNLSRLVLEAEQIQEHLEEGVLNSKSEFRGTKVIRLIPNKEQF